MTCTPACQNGGTCRGNSSYTYCDCPKNYTGPHCENRGTATHTHTAGGPGNMQMVFSYLLLILLHISAIQDQFARYQQSSNEPLQYHAAWIYVHSYVCFLFADCSPACQNRGTCHRSSSNAYCDCPSGYTGDYCQNEGIYAHSIRSIPLQASLIQSLTSCSDLYTSLSEWGNMSW